MPIKSLPPTMMPQTPAHVRVSDSVADLQTTKKVIQHHKADVAKKVLLLRCKDVPGIVAEVTGFLADCGFFIHESAQFGEKQDQLFFMRVVFSPIHKQSSKKNCRQLRSDFAFISERYQMDVIIEDLERKQHMLLMVSRESHCMHDILYRAECGILPVHVAGVVSNHEKLRSIAERYHVPYHYLPVSDKNRKQQEQHILDLIKTYDVSLTVLAKYMQILTPDLAHRLAGKAINIHHSFLPSFKGGRPYHQAYSKGVKIIGATAHYVSDMLDEGPIIEQEVTRVDRPSCPKDMAAAGRDVEAKVLSEAIRYHLEYRVLMNGNRTVVFK